MKKILNKGFVVRISAVLLLHFILPGNVFAANHEKYLDSYIDFENMELGAATQQQISDNYAVTYNAESEPNAQNGGVINLYPGEGWSNGVDTYTSVAAGGNDLTGKAADDKYLLVNTDSTSARFVFCPSKLWEMIDLYKNAGTTVNNVLNISFDIAVNKSGQNQDIYGYLGWGNGGAQRISLFDMKYGSNGIRLLSESSGFPSSGGIDANVWHHLDYQFVQNSATELLASVWADGKYIMTKNVMPASGYDGQFDRVYFDIAQGNRMYLDNLHIQAIPAENQLNVKAKIYGFTRDITYAKEIKVGEDLTKAGVNPTLSGATEGVDVIKKDGSAANDTDKLVECQIEITRKNDSKVYIPFVKAGETLVRTIDINEDGIAPGGGRLDADSAGDGSGTMQATAVVAGVAGKRTEDYSVKNYAANLSGKNGENIYHMTSCQIMNRIWNVNQVDSAMLSGQYAMFSFSAMSEDPYNEGLQLQMQANWEGTRNVVVPLNGYALTDHNRWHRYDVMFHMIDNPADTQHPILQTTVFIDGAQYGDTADFVWSSTALPAQPIGTMRVGYRAFNGDGLKSTSSALYVDDLTWKISEAPLVTSLMPSCSIRPEVLDITADADWISVPKGTTVSELLNALEFQSCISQTVYQNESYTSVTLNESDMISNGNILVLGDADNVCLRYYTVFVNSDSVCTSVNMRMGGQSLLLGEDKNVTEATVLPKVTARFRTKSDSAHPSLMIGNYEDDVLSGLVKREAVNGTASLSVTQEEEKVYRAYTWDIQNLQPLGDAVPLFVE